MTIAHISDIHFGRIKQPGIVEHLVEEINAAGVDLVAVSGDLTMRARPHEFRSAVEMLDALQPPVLVVPGNHDVYPWWRPYRRLRHPLGRYRTHVTADLLQTFKEKGLAVLGINSAHGRTMKGGRIGPLERATIRSFFQEQEPDVFKVLVVHHHLTLIQALAPHDVARKAQKTLEVASSVGVDLVLCGHLHVSHIEPLELAPGRHRMVIVSAGTATSSRGRGRHAQTNLYNLIRISPESFEIEERIYEPEAGRFVKHDETLFSRIYEMQD
ncbi:MAG TPA: metallophosphoesterase family protein [Rhodothermales bacterium]|nr:metallophosphoesterase family protein [Rhodothermales bacterium]